MNQPAEQFPVEGVTDEPWARDARARADAVMLAQGLHPVTCEPLTDEERARYCAPAQG